MRVVVDFPDRAGWALAGAAERRGMKLADLIVQTMTAGVADRPDGRALSTLERVRGEWEKGAPAPVIAHRLGVTQEAVRVSLRRLGLRTHKFRRDQWQHELVAEDAA